MLVNVKADVLITGEMSHHEILDCVEAGKAVILCGHCNSERHFLPKLQALLRIVLGGADYTYPDIIIPSRSC